MLASLPVAFCRLFIIIILSQKLKNDAIDHAWIYPASTTKQRSSSGPFSLLTVSLNYPLSTKTNICSICKWKHTKLSPVAECLDPPHEVVSLPDLPGYDRTWGCWLQPLHINMKTYFTAIQSWCKLFVLRPCSLT